MVQTIYNGFAGVGLDKFLDGLDIEDGDVYKLTKEILIQESVTVDQLYHSISEQDLEEVGIPEISRRLIRSAVQVFCPQVM